jgi:predicted patatin/cPLA2 family phospholipase
LEEKLLVIIEPKRSALVVEGGGMRGIFAAGVLHAFGRAGFNPFDLYIGVSAGACNLASHLAGQNDRNHDIMVRYSSTSKFINYWRFLLGGHLMDLDWLWGITIREYRLDLEHLFTELKRQTKEFIVVATSMESGQALYLLPEKDTLEHYLKVSSSVPLLYRNILEINSEKATDGGVSDSIPVIEAVRRGATDVTVIRTRPSSYVKKSSRLSSLYPVLFRKYPRFAQALRDRSKVYRETVRFINNPPRNVKIKEIAPPENLEMHRVTRDLKSLEAAFRAGIEYGSSHIKGYNAQPVVTKHKTGDHHQMFG